MLILIILYICTLCILFWIWLFLFNNTSWKSLEVTILVLPTAIYWKKSYDQPRQHIKKQRHYFADKGPSSQSYGFSSSHVWMWELDYKERWALKNWHFWTVVLEKTLESPLECNKIQPTPVLLPGKSYGWRSLEGCSPCGHWGSDLTERLHFATAWTADCQAPPSLGFSRQEYWSGLSFPSDWFNLCKNPGDKGEMWKYSFEKEREMDLKAEETWQAQFLHKDNHIMYGASFLSKQ